MTTAVWMRSLLLVLALTPSLALTPTTAHAQPKGAKGTASSDDAAAKRATALFIKGSTLFKMKKYSLALDQFKQSYAAVASPNSHLYIARCLAALGDSRAAYIEFNKVIDEASARAATEEKYAPTRDTAQEERDELLPKIALVTISVPQADSSVTVRLGAEIVAREQWDKPIPYPPGTVDATLQSDGRPDVTETLTLKGGDKKSVVLNPPSGFDKAPPSPIPPAPTEPPAEARATSKTSPLRTAAFITGGVGIAGMGMFTAFGILTLSAHSDLTIRCDGKRCPLALKDEVGAAKTKQAVANVSFAIGAIGLATGTTLFILSLRKPKKESVPSAWLVVSPSYAGVHGEF